MKHFDDDDADDDDGGGDDTPNVKIITQADIAITGSSSARPVRYMTYIVVASDSTHRIMTNKK